MREVEERNSEILSDTIKQLASSEEGLIIGDLHQCL